MPLQLSKNALVSTIFHPIKCLVLGNKQWTYILVREQILFPFGNTSTTELLIVLLQKLMFVTLVGSEVESNGCWAPKLHHICPGHLPSAIIVIYIRYMVFDLHAQIWRMESFICHLLENNSQNLWFTKCKVDASNIFTLQVKKLNPREFKCLVSKK